MESRVGFVTGIESLWQHQLVAVKQGLHTLSGGPTPDVYAFPRFLGTQSRFIRSGQTIDRAAFDLVFSELDAGDDQLAYLASLVATQPPPVVVLPGPPEILIPRLTHERLRLVRRILDDAYRVLVYSPALADFYDGLTGRARARVVPWPFDYLAVRALADTPVERHDGSGEIHVVVNVPLRFVGLTQNYPFVLKAALADALASLAPADRDRLRFHTFVYDAEDRDAFHRSGFADGLPIVLEARRPYGAFVRFLDRCDAIVNLTTSSVVGRITFLAGALGKPGLFSTNAPLNAALYPSATIPLLRPAALREALIGLLRGLAADNVPAAFLPDETAVRRVGDFGANAARFRDVLSAS